MRSRDSGHRLQQPFGTLRFLLATVIAISLTLLVSFPAMGQVEVSGEVQEVFPQAEYSELGLAVPEGETPTLGDGRRVVVPGLDDEPVVAEIYLKYRNGYVVLLPNGYLKSVSKAKATPTERPFEPATEREMVAELTSKFEGFKALTTPRYIFVYNCSPAFAKGTSRIINSMYRKLFQYCQGIDDEVHEPRFPLVMILFKTEEEFQNYRAMPPGVAAYYNGVSNQVLLYEQSKLTEMVPALSMKQSISTIAHESVHQVLHNVGVQPRLSRWPMWISEGLPEYFAPTQVTTRATWKGIGQPNDLRMYELKKSLDGGSRGLDILDAVNAKQLDSLGYARSWALVHYLGQRNSQNLFAMLRDMSRTIQPGHDGPEPGTYFEKYFSGVDDLEDKVMEHLKKTPYRDPIANQTHYVALAKFGPTLQGMTTISQAAVTQWRQQISQRQNGQVQFQIRVFPNRAEAERFMKRTFP